MNQEELDFTFFKENQLLHVDFTTGRISTSRKGRHICEDVGSLNPDGYVRIWANRKLRMKHRLIYWLKYGVLPQSNEDIDHIDNDRSNNAIGNLRILPKGENNARRKPRTFKHMSKDTVVQLCQLLACTELSDQAIADKVGTSRATVRDIKTRRTRTSISKDYSWKHRER